VLALPTVLTLPTELPLSTVLAPLLTGELALLAASL
jgi:hypothetical protein